MKNLLKVLLVVLLCVALFSAGRMYGEHTVRDVQNDIDLGPFWEAWGILENKFVSSTDKEEDEELTSQDKVYGAIRGLAASYKDPYTVFFPPEENELFESDIQGEFSGIGIEIGVKNNALTVVSPLNKTPAFRAGLQAEDIIVEIDGVESVSISPSAAAKMIRGEQGTEVVLTILREGEMEFLEIPIIRDVIEIPTIETEVQGDVYIISFYTFNARATEEFFAAMQNYERSGLSKLIIDVRGNPGGFLNSAIDIASLFIEKDKVVVTESFENKRPDAIRLSKGFNIVDEDDQIIMLTDGGSASASEILAGALRDYDRAQLVGENTFGKGSVQELVPITRDTALKLTIARWILPSGEQISEDGIEPDVLIEDDTETEEDEILLKALEILAN